MERSASPQRLHHCVCQGNLFAALRLLRVFLLVGRFLLLRWDAYKNVPMSGCVHHGHRCSVPGTSSIIYTSFLENRIHGYNFIDDNINNSKDEITFTSVVTELHLFDSEHGGKETNNYLQKYEVHQYYYVVFFWSKRKRIM